MKPRHAFGVAVRVIGLILGLAGGYCFLCGLVVVIDPQYNVRRATAPHFFVFGILGLLGGNALIRGARRIVRFAYPDDDSDE